MLQHKNARQWRTVGGRKHGFAVPRGTVHTHVRWTEGVTAHDNAIITQDFDIFGCSPESGSRALPRPRMTDKEIANAIRTDDTRAVQFNRLLLRQVMHDEQLIQGI